MKYSVQAAARAAGVTEGRLRTWERRFGVPAPARSETGRRLYSEPEIELIRRLAALVDAGVPVIEAVRAVQSGEAVAPPLAQPAPADSQLVQALVDATFAFDVTAAASLIAESVEKDGPGEAMRTVLFPALTRVGHSWERAECTPAHEHFLSGCVRSAIEAFAAAGGPPPAAAPLIILACPPDEHHDIGLLALRALLLRAPVRVLYLGTDLPNEALIAAARQTKPAVICLAATAPTSLPALGLAARMVVKARLPLHLFVGGPALGAGEGLEIPGLPLPADLDRAAERLAAVARAGAIG